MDLLFIFYLIHNFSNEISILCDIGILVVAIIALSVYKKEILFKKKQDLLSEIYKKFLDIDLSVKELRNPRHKVNKEKYLGKLGKIFRLLSSFESSVFILKIYCDNDLD